MDRTKFNVVVFVILSLFGIFSIEAQNKSTKKTEMKNGKISGIVRYKYNDYQGYKADVGSIIYLVPLNLIENIISYDDLRRYEDLAGKKTQYDLALREYDYNKTLAYMASHYLESDNEIIKELDPKILDAFVSAKSNKINMALVDGSGMFSMEEIPYGEYYIVYKSKNRERGTVSEINGRLHFEKINLSSPMEILEYDFDY